MNGETYHIPLAFVVTVKHRSHDTDKLLDMNGYCSAMRGVDAGWLDKLRRLRVMEFFVPEAGNWVELMGNFRMCLERRGVVGASVRVQALLGRRSVDEILRSINDGTINRGRADCVGESRWPAYRRWKENRW